MSEPLDDLIERVEYLEAQNHALKRVGAIGLVLLFVVGACLVYQTWAELGAVVTQGLVLNDSSGPRYGMTVTPQGGLGLVTYRGGQLAVLGRTAEDLNGLVLYDSQGRSRIVIGLSPDDQARLAIYDENGRVVWQALDLRTAAPPPAASPSPAAPSPSPATGVASPAPKPSAKPTN
ncbi:hypothetical protein DYH09_02380 [bacterium CPR1]|nr:hypothetical protein [bacterium CPR1]